MRQKYPLSKSVKIVVVGGKAEAEAEAAVVEGEGEFQMQRERAVVLELPVDDDPSFDLAKAVCSHGLFMMAPNRWDPTTGTLHRPLRISSSSSSCSVSISQPSPSQPLILITVLLDDASATSLSPHHQQALLGQVRRMLRISEENGRVIREFHHLHEGAKERGFGRIFRSPTLFEDMVKCILLCNCQWSRTLSMARALCELQLELRSHSAGEDFYSKTPPKRELKRKRGKGKKTVTNLETRLLDNETMFSGDANSIINSDNQPEHPQGKEQCASFLSDTGDSGNITSSSQPLNISSSGFPTLPNEVGDFPTPEELANLDSEFLAESCRLGYRAQHIISLAKSVVDGTLQLKNLERVCDGHVSASYEEMERQLCGIKGFGPFTRANVLMCMGFYNRIPTDTETLRHLKMVHARSCTIRSVEKDLDAIYGKYGEFQFLAYWFELWDYYERRFGNLTEMPASDYRLITASNMKNKITKRTRKR